MARRRWKECAWAGHYDTSLGTHNTTVQLFCITEERDDSVFAKDATPAGLRRMCLEQVLLLVYIREGLSTVGQTCANLSTQMAGESARFAELFRLVRKSTTGHTQRIGDPWRSITKVRKGRCVRKICLANIDRTPRGSSAM